MIQINISKLRNIPGAHLDMDLRCMPECSRYGYDDLRFAEDLTFRGQVENCGNGMYKIDGAYQGKLVLTCSRCAQAFFLPAAGDLHRTYIAQQAKPAPEDSDDSEEEETIHFSGNDIDITQEILTEIYLSLPMQPLCRPDCRGLCPVCGQDLNNGSCACKGEQIDPRWQKLKDFVESKKGV
ncbi:MAG: DUF177 domain-containing protein [Firmicutes bacterium]|nr:DUF177 domain-containing protein [Bacillota bacterium]